MPSRKRICPSSLIILCLWLSGSSQASAEDKGRSTEPIQVALTFDDLPYVWETPPGGYSNKQLIEDLVAVLAKHGVRGAFAFANAAKAADRANKEILDLWTRSGHRLGNHTWSHPDLNSTPSADYIAEISRNHDALTSYGASFSKFFRYPFLHEGNTQEKRDAVRRHLATAGYRIAQVTVDHNDWEWYAPLGRCLAKNNQEKIKWLRDSYNQEASENLKAAKLLSQFLFGRQIKHIALFHPNAMSVQQLDDVLTIWAASGAEFIALEDAMNDPVYQIDPNVVRDHPNLFTNQVRVMRGLANPPEVLAIFRRTGEVEAELERVCN